MRLGDAGVEPYKYALLIDAHDPRRINVGVLSDLPLEGIRTHMDERVDGEWMYSRDCLEITVHLPEHHGRALTVFVNHLKSKFVKEDDPNTPPEVQRQQGDKRRRVQAEAVRELLLARFPGARFDEEWFMVVGDMNDAPGSAPVQPLVNWLLENALNRLPEHERWTHYWDKQRQVSQIDYLLLSPALSTATQGVMPYVERRGLPTRGLGADGRPLPREAKLVVDDTYDPSVPYGDFRPPVVAEVGFRHERFLTPEDGSKPPAASDHCAVFLELP